MGHRLPRVVAAVQRKLWGAARRAIASNSLGLYERRHETIPSTVTSSGMTGNKKVKIHGRRLRGGRRSVRYQTISGVASRNAAAARERQVNSKMAIGWPLAAASARIASTS